MSKQITITKKNILDALKYEPLASGCWVAPADENDYNFSGKRIDQVEACKVCAVGGTFRRKLAKSAPEMTFSDLRVISSDAALNSGDCSGTVVGTPKLRKLHLAEVRTQLKGKAYIRALSNRFEWLMKHYPTKKVRVILSAWVKKNFPEKFNTSITDLAA